MVSLVQQCHVHRHASPPPQLKWTAYVMSTNFASARTLRTAELLRSVNISDVKLFHAITAAPSLTTDKDEMRKVRSNLLTQRGIYDRIARSPGPDDEYVLLFEDDVMLAPNVAPRNVVRLMACAARYSLRAKLPLFYAGACAPIDAGGRMVVAGHPAVSEGAALVRAHARCAHAYAVRRGDARAMRALADARPDNAPTHKRTISAVDRSWYMDVQLEHLGEQRGGFYVAAPAAAAPHDPWMRGIFYQDRANGGSNASRTGLSILRGVQIVGTSGRAPAETSVLLRATRCESAPCHRRDIPVHDQGRRTEDEDRRHPRFARWRRIDSSFLTGWLPSSKFFIVDQHALRL